VTDQPDQADQPLFDRINQLAAEEEQLWEQAADGGGLGTADHERLEKIKVELDQCYDLLHQRDARRSAGFDPDKAKLRPADVVERYQQ